MTADGTKQKNLTRNILIDGVHRDAWKRDLFRTGTSAAPAAPPHEPEGVAADDVRHPLDVSAAWPMVRAAALEALRTGVRFESGPQKVGYRITDVGDAKISIDRLNGGSPETLSEGEVARAIITINEAGARSAAAR